MIHKLLQSSIEQDLDKEIVPMDDEFIPLREVIKGVSEKGYILVAMGFKVYGANLYNVNP